MTRQRMQGENFEERALSLLKAEVAERGADEEGRPTIAPAWRRRGPRLALASAAVASIAAAALIVNAGGGDTPVAFAVEPQPEGMVSVEVNSLEDAKGLEAALEEVGIPASVNYLPAGMACREPRFRRVPWPEGARAISVARIVGHGPSPFASVGPLRFLISRNAVEPGQALIITASPSTAGEGIEGIFNPGGQVELAEGAVAPCEPVPVAPGGDSE